jgi:hypothetical protein
MRNKCFVTLVPLQYLVMLLGCCVTLRLSELDCLHSSFVGIIPSKLENLISHSNVVISQVSHLNQELPSSSMRLVLVAKFTNAQCYLEVVFSASRFFTQTLSGSSLPSLRFRFCAQTLLFRLHLIIKFLLLPSFMLQSKGSLVPFVFRPLVCCCTSVSIYHDLLGCNQIISSCLDNPLHTSSANRFFTQALSGSSLPSLRTRFCT